MFDSNVNNAGRGVNVAVYDTASSTVVQTNRFDTYEVKDGKLIISNVVGISDENIMKLNVHLLLRKSQMSVTSVACAKMAIATYSSHQWLV